MRDNPGGHLVAGRAEAVEQNLQAEEQIKAGDYRTFDNVDFFVRSLEEENDLPAATAEPSKAVTLRDAERAYILAALKANKENKRAAAKFFSQRLKKITLERELQQVK